MADNEVEYLGTKESEVKYIKTNPSEAVYIKTELSAELKEILDSARFAQPKRQLRQQQKQKQKQKQKSDRMFNHPPTRINAELLKLSEPRNAVKRKAEVQNTQSKRSKPSTSSSSRASTSQPPNPKPGQSSRPPPEVIDLISDDDDDVIMFDDDPDIAARREEAERETLRAEAERVEEERRRIQEKEEREDEEYDEEGYYDCWPESVVCPRFFNPFYPPYAFYSAHNVNPIPSFSDVSLEDTFKPVHYNEDRAYDITNIPWDDRVPYPDNCKRRRARRYTMHYRDMALRGLASSYRYFPPRVPPAPKITYRTAGAVNRIYQIKGSFATASAVYKGGPDETDREEHFYVKSGSLSIFRAGEDHLARPDQWEIHRLTEDGPKPDKEYHEHMALKTAFRRKCMQEHSFQYAVDRPKSDDAQEKKQRKNDEAKKARMEEAHREALEAGKRPPDLVVAPNEYRWNEYEFIKLYTVNSIAYDPRSGIIASSSTDKTIRFTPLQHAKPFEGYECPTHALKFPHGVPYEMAFSPRRLPPILAVAGKHIVLYHDPFGKRPAEETLQLAPRAASANHIIGCLAWGRKDTSNYLFASTEYTESVSGKGFHKAFDLGDRFNRPTYVFKDATEAGDEMAVSPNGEQLALVTAPTTTKRCLRLYDIKNKHTKATNAIMLEEFGAGIGHPQVNSVSFSPGEIQLAVARSDNSLHLYDTRFLNKVLNRFSHLGESKVLPNEAGVREPYGIVQAEWLGLVTGGEDGFVRLWDPQSSLEDPDNGGVIGEIDSDVARFSLGDWTEKEHPLIVGGSNGNISIFDRQPYFYKIPDDD
ncbi:WD40 repeat-like protein [Hymenopellis radicata]|nr:WD40 repeat-like protein [Hymenopellis radicata]